MLRRGDGSVLETYPSMGQQVVSVVFLGFTRLPLTWVAPAAAGTTTLNICITSSEPGSYPDRALEGVCRC